jgi:hypothetical protein
MSMSSREYHQTVDRKFSRFCFAGSLMVWGEDYYTINTST